MSYNLIYDNNWLLLELVMDLMQIRQDLPEYFIKRDGPEAKELMDKLIMATYFQMLSALAKYHKTDDPPLSLERSYGITEDEIKGIKDRLIELKSGEVMVEGK